MAQVTAWSARSIARWAATWLAVHTAAQFAALTSYYLWAARASDLREILGMAGLMVLVICLLQGVVSISLLWALGRSRQPRTFRRLSVLLLFGMWLPLQVTFLILEIAPAWLAILPVALLIRQPEPAYYGAVSTRR